MDPTKVWEEIDATASDHYWINLRIDKVYTNKSVSTNTFFFGSGTPLRRPSSQKNNQRQTNEWNYGFSGEWDGYLE